MNVEQFTVKAKSVLCVGVPDFVHKHAIVPSDDELSKVVSLNFDATVCHLTHKEDLCRMASHENFFSFSANNNV